MVEPTKTYTHETQTEVASISGYYEIEKEYRIKYGGSEVLIVLGNAVVDNSCCGVGGCRYAVVPGFVLTWKSGMNERGLPISQVELIRDPTTQSEISNILKESESVTQVQFW